MDKVHEHDLRETFGDRYSATDELILTNFSRDQVENPSYYQRPVAVVFPETREEVAALMKCTNRHRIPVTPRGPGVI